jgi:hypothetical protein
VGAPGGARPLTRTARESPDGRTTPIISRRKQRAIIAGLAIAIVAILAAGLLQMDRVLVWWHRGKLLSPDEGVRAKAVLALGRLGYWTDRNRFRAKVLHVESVRPVAVLGLGEAGGATSGAVAVVVRNDAVRWGHPVGVVVLTRTLPHCSWARVVKVADGERLQASDEAWLLEIPWQDAAP